MSNNLADSESADAVATEPRTTPGGISDGRRRVVHQARSAHGEYGKVRSLIRTAAGSGLTMRKLCEGVLPGLPDYEQLVRALEAGELPTAFESRRLAFNGLVDWICGHPWKTAEERSQAQSLVARLERQRWKEAQGWAGHPNHHERATQV